MSAVVESSVEGAVCTITLADEARRNALSTQLVEELLAAVDAAEADPAVRVVVLTNRGGTFCAGADLSAGTGPQAALQRPEELFGRCRRSPKPFVGRLAGHCLAGGTGLAASLDVAIAVDTARFGFTEVRLGLAPAVISVVCLPKLRPADARSLMLRGTRFDAVEAARLGLIAAAVPAERLDEAVDEVVADLLAGEPGAIAATKQLLDRVPSMPEAEAYAWASEVSAERFASPAGQEGMAAFKERRPPSWADEAGRTGTSRGTPSQR